MTNAIEKLNNWYQAQCNGDWEHSYGVKIDTLDNPGWLVKIDLIDTALDSKGFSEIAQGIEGSSHLEAADWLHCYVSDRQFVGAGDPSKLENIIKVFVDWAA